MLDAWSAKPEIGLPESTFDTMNLLTKPSQPLERSRLIASKRSSRICMPSWRKFKKYAFQGALYEAQDVLLEVDDVDLICPEPGWGYGFLEGWQKRLVWKDVTKRLVYLNPGLRPIHLKRDYDLFVTVCQSWWDILYLNAIKGVKDHCKTSICWFDELWAKWIPDYGFWLHALNQFDYVVVALEGSVNALEKALGRSCHWMPGAVDAVRFSPYPNPPPRVIDVYSIGRRREELHHSLLKMAEEGEIFYIYDTFPASMAHPPDHRQHRDLLANISKRSRFFVVGPAKIGCPDDARGQIEIGSRYFEGAASGAVMIGEAALCESFNQLFGWENSVIEIKADGSDVGDILRALSAQPAQLREMGQRNAREVLLRHDWVYRWKQILAIAGVNPSPAMERRENQLRKLATLAGSGEVHETPSRGRSL
jgi:spore maturation protein CgeB